MLAHTRDGGRVVEGRAHFGGDGAALEYSADLLRPRNYRGRGITEVADFTGGAVCKTSAESTLSGILEQASGEYGGGHLLAACADDGGVRRGHAGAVGDRAFRREAGGHSVDELVTLLSDRYAPGRVRAFAAELRKLEMLQPSGSLRTVNPGSVKVNSYPLSTLVLNV